jgi:two-component system sensor histidine kinase AlgZ
VWSSPEVKTKSSIANPSATMSNADVTFFLPEFAEPATLRLVLITVNLLALFISLLPLNTLYDFSIEAWLRPAFFVNWVTVLAAILADHLRGWLMRLPRATALAVCFFAFELIILAMSGVVSVLDNILHHRQWSFSHLIHKAILNLLLGGMIGWLLLQYLYLREQLVIRNRAELVSRVQALQARIRPHFLFNSMNTLMTLISIDTVRAEQVVEDMSALLRASLQAAGEVSLSDEIHLCERYLALEQLRLGDRLVMDWRLPDEDTLYDLMIPSLTLQPLLENAVYHGVESRSEPSTISVLIESDVDEVRIVVTNPCQAGTKNRSGNRMALDNIEERLRVYYGPLARLCVYQGDGLFTVYLSYPQDSTITNA